MFQFPCRKSDSLTLISREQKLPQKSLNKKMQIYFRRDHAPIPQSGKIIAIVLSHSVNVMDVV